MRIVLMMVMLLTVTGLLVNAGRQIFLWLILMFQNICLPVYGVVFGLIVLAVLAAFAVSRLPGMGAYGTLFRISHYALGVLVYVALAANAVSVLLFAGRFVHVIPPRTPYGVQAASGALSLLLVAGLSVYGSVHARDIQTRRYTVRLGREQGGRAGEQTLRIALVSDIHLGYVIGERHLAGVVERVNALEPDIICIAGDVFDGDITSLSDPDQLQALFGEMKAEYGVYACLGNHDAGAGYQQMLDFLYGAGIRVLMDESVVVDQRFVLAGRRDSSPIGGQGDHRRALEGWPGTERLPVIVLDHQPGNIHEYGNETDLVLCGHTHKGQMFPFDLITGAVFDVDYGYYRSGDTGPQVIVTSGAGTWGPPMRVATDSEIVEISVLLPGSDTGNDSQRVKENGYEKKLDQTPPGRGV